MADSAQELSTNDHHCTLNCKYQRGHTVLTFIFSFLYLKEDDVKGSKFEGLWREAAGPAVLRRSSCSPGLAAWKVATAGS